MPPRSRLSPADLAEIKHLYPKTSIIELSFLFASRGITISPSTIYYHLGLRKKHKSKVKTYLDVLRSQVILIRDRKGNIIGKEHRPFKNPRSRSNRWWS